MKSLIKIGLGLIFLNSLSVFGQTESVDKPPKELIMAVESMPEYPGGDHARVQYLKTNVQLPKGWKPDSIVGKVYITFLVDVNGNIKNPKILRSLNPILDSIALNAVSKMPKWIPAKQKGKPVACQYNLPIKFGPDNKKKN
jgi:TonB family protein